MGWVKKVKIDRHECKPPELPKLSEQLKYDEGSIWQCGRRKCLREYRIVKPSFPRLTGRSARTTPRTASRAASS